MAVVLSNGVAPVLVADFERQLQAPIPHTASK